MGKVAYRLKGHESFVLREGWVTKGLNAVRSDPTIMSSNYAADAMGVGTNMAKSIRYWLKASGLTKEIQRTGTILTELGELILKYDPYLEKLFTLWILHANIAKNFALATSWNVFFNYFDLNSWKRDEMASLMEEYLIEHTGDTALSPRSVKDDCNAILSMYTYNETDGNDPEELKSCPFTSLGLMQKTNSYYERVNKTTEQVGIYPILYLIADLLNENNYLSIDQILTGNNLPGKLYQLNRIQVNNALDALAEAGYLTVNRTAGLDVVYPSQRISSIEIVSTFYVNQVSDGEYIL